MVRSKMRVDKRIPIDFLSGFSAKLKCGIGDGRVKTISGVNWTITWKNAANMIGADNVGKNRTLTCKLVVRGAEGRSTKTKDVELISHSASIIIPAPITMEHFKLKNKSKAEISKVASPFPFAPEIDPKEGGLGEFEQQY